MSERGWMLAIVGSGLVACGSSSDSTPDSATADTTAPKLVSTTPTGNVPILSQLTATFDEPLDSATVSTSTVHLSTRLDDSFPAIPGAVDYDAATNTLTFAPLRPLVYDAIYELQIGAVTDTKGNAFEGATVPFHAVVNAVTKEVSYTNNVISAYNTFELDANGHQTKYLFYPSWGTNMTWFDNDDPIGAHEASDYSATGLYLAYRQYSAGSDSTLGTSDDPVVLRDEYTYDTSNRLTKFAELAADQTVRIDYSWSGRKLMMTQTFTDPGNDAVWNTSDDRGPQWREFSHDATGATTRQTTYNNGGDQKPQTNDDFIMQSTTFDRDATSYVVTKQVAYGAAGSDMMWMTPDDVVANYQTMMTDARGLLLARTAYSAKGNDNMWFTSDDVVSNRLVITYDAKQCETLRESRNAADAVLSYMTTEYDASGNRTKQTLYMGAGQDGIWHTQDDGISVERTFDTTH